MIKNILLGVILISYPFFIQAKSCFTINDISVRLDDNSTSDGDFSKFKIYHNDKVLFFYEALEVDHNINNVEYSDLDFDGEKEIILRVDNDPSHDVEYAVLKLKCDKLEMHPLFPEVKSYELLDNKKIKVYYKDGYSIKEKIYCFQSIGYLCEEKYIIRNNYELRKLYSSNGKVSSVGIYYNQNEILPSIREKSYLYYDLNKRSNMYLVKGDKVNILDEKVLLMDRVSILLITKEKKKSTCGLKLIQLI